MVEFQTLTSNFEHIIAYRINPFLANVLILYPLKTSVFSGRIKQTHWPEICWSNLCVDIYKILSSFLIYYLSYFASYHSLYLSNVFVHKSTSIGKTLALLNSDSHSLWNVVIASKNRWSWYTKSCTKVKHKITRQIDSLLHFHLEPLF